MIQILGLVLPLTPVVLLVATKLLFLAPTRLGWIFYYSNVFVEFLSKRFRASRLTVEVLLFAAFVVGAIFTGPQPLAYYVSVTAVLLLLDVSVRIAERKVLTAVYSHADTRRFSLPEPHGSEPLAGPYPDPSRHPDLVINLRGPLLSRRPKYDLGDLAVGRVTEIGVLIGNHSAIPCQVPVEVEVKTAHPSIEIRLDPGDRTILRAGEVRLYTLAIVAGAPSGPGSFDVHVVNADRKQRIQIHFRSVFSADGDAIETATVTRYPGGCRGAFAWRGDMDHYDLCTFQSIDGLQKCFGLARRYRFPQTMYLSTRLCLDREESNRFHDHFSVDRGQSEIPQFIDWMRNEVELVHWLEYPWESEKRFAVEVGNHGHLHFGTDAAAAEENEWRLSARMGDGSYPWLGSDHTSFGEQRDNALEASRRIERHFGFTPKSWAMPDRTNDEFTARAMEAAGCEVLSDSNARPVDNVVYQPRPHHPPGTNAVELTKRYPGDPQDVYQLGMNKFWIERAWRLGIPVVFMCHQHMLRFDDYGCERFTESILRSVLTGFNGDLHVNTVFGVGKYFREVLSADTATVNVTHDTFGFELVNRSDIDLENIPVDVAFRSGRRATYFVSAQSGDSRRVEVVPAT